MINLQLHFAQLGLAQLLNTDLSISFIASSFIQEKT
jgi:hypothetical protein